MKANDFLRARVGLLIFFNIADGLVPLRNRVRNVGGFFRHPARNRNFDDVRSALEVNPQDLVHVVQRLGVRQLIQVQLGRLRGPCLLQVQVPDHRQQDLRRLHEVEFRLELGLIQAGVDARR